MRGQNRATLGAVALVLATFVGFVGVSAFTDSAGPPAEPPTPSTMTSTTVPESAADTDSSPNRRTPFSGP
jgi:hypothetical protein